MGSLCYVVVEREVFMSYENATATKMMATQCICCGRPLVDAISITLGIGPECRKGYDAGISEEVQEKANKLIFRAAEAAQRGAISVVKGLAVEIRDLGLVVVADKIDRRFKNADRYSEIVISLDGGEYRVETPFRRAMKEEFIAAWRAIPGRTFKNEANYIPVEQKQALWSLLMRFFGGRFGNGPKGVFKIPSPAPFPRQRELNLE
jgi:hypothetical protein